jgi:hypothetical protein
MKIFIVLPLIFISLNSNSQIITKEKAKANKIKSFKTITNYPGQELTMTNEIIYDTNGITKSMIYKTDRAKSRRINRYDFFYTNTGMGYSLQYLNDTLIDSTVTIKPFPNSISYSYHNGKLYRISEYKGDSLHRISIETSYNLKDTFVMKGETFNTYNAQGKREKRVQIETDQWGGRSDTTSFETTIYQDEFHFEVWDQFAENEHYKIQDDTLHKTYTEISFDKKGRCYKKEITQFDKFGNVLEEDVYNRKNKLVSKYVSSYDENGMEISSRETGQQSSNDGYWTYTYNEKGLQLGQKHFDRKDKLDTEVKYEYEYYE